MKAFRGYRSRKAFILAQFQAGVLPIDIVRATAGEIRSSQIYQTVNVFRTGRRPKLAEHARKHKITYTRLCTMLLDIIERDDALIDSILDGELDNAK